MKLKRNIIPKYIGIALLILLCLNFLIPDLSLRAYVFLISPKSALTMEYVEDKEHNTITVTRTITKIRKLYDVSAVSIPANDATQISARNISDGLIKEIAAERKKALDHIRKRKKLELKLKIMEV